MKQQISWSFSSWSTRVLLILLHVHTVVSQGQTAMNFQSIGVEQGLTQNSVYSLFQDSRGFLWIGTADGLNRYDGRTIKTYKSLINISEPFNANLIRGNMAEDKNGNIWYTSEDGLYMYHRQHDKVISKHLFTRNEIRDFKLSFISKDENVWMFGPGLGFASYSISDGSFKMFPHGIKFPGSVLASKTILPDGQENIWFSLTQFDGMYRFNTSNKSIDHFFIGEDLYSILFVKGGHYRVSAHTILFYDSSKRSTKQLQLTFSKEKNQPITGMLLDNSGRIWIATQEDGLFLYDPVSEKTLNFRSESGQSSLPTDRLTCLLLDNRDNLWIGTEGAGVSKLSIQLFIFKSSVPVRPKLFIRSIAEDEAGNILVASLDNPLYKIDVGTGKLIELQQFSRLGIRNVNRIYLDNKQRIWIIQGSVIYLLNKAGNVLAKGSLNLKPASEVFYVDQLRTGQTVLSTSEGMIFTSIEGMKILVDNSLKTFQSTAFIETDDGELWASSRYSGLVQLENFKKNAFQIRRLILPHLSVNALHQDNKSNEILWLASSKGLVKYNRQTESVKVYTENEGLVNNYVYGILEDSLGRLWLSTNGGISCFTKSSESFLNYTSKDGLQSNEFNTGAFLKGKSDNFYFGGINGVNWFNPEEVTSTRQPPAVAITEILVNDVPIRDSVLHFGQVLLHYNENDLVVRFSVFDFSQPESNKVRYKLMGVDDKSHITTFNEVSYNNLSPGNYQLIFSASNTSNVWSKDQTLTLIIGAPYWKETWFIFLVIAIASGVIILITWLIMRSKYQARIAELEMLRAIDVERQRISREMHDDIGAGLTQISLMSESVRSKTNHDIAELDDIADTSRKLVSNIGEIVWSLNPENKTLQQVIIHLREQLHNQLEHTDINYSITLPEIINDLPINNEQRKNILLVAREIVHNAIKHSKAKNIAIDGQYVNSILQMRIKDDGVGFDPGTVTAGNGLKNIKARVAQMNGSIKIESALNHGGSFTLTVKI